MGALSPVLALLLCLVACRSSSSATNDVDGRGRSRAEEELGNRFAKQLDAVSSEMCNREVQAEWRYATDLTDENAKLKVEQGVIAARFQKEVWNNVTRFDWQKFQDPDLRRRFRLLSVLGPSALPEDKLTELMQIINDMQKTYSTAKICAYRNRSDCGLGLEPEITDIMRESRDFDELQWTWLKWHDQSGGKMRHQYRRFVELSNEAARLNNLSDAASFWLRDYESETFRADVEEIWNTIRPFYLELHAYVREKLGVFYGKDRVRSGAPIPAHLLGDMWAQQWTNILDITVPYPNSAKEPSGSSAEVTRHMEHQGYTPLSMFQKADEFFTSLGLIPMPFEFWNGSVLEKPIDRDIVCHASAWDFCNGKDYRIKQCTSVNMNDFITAHHEMGHIQYFLQYKNQPLVYRQGANPGFHEAIGDTLALSVKTSQHMKKLGLTEASGDEHDQAAIVNHLFATALEKLAFFPFAYVVDKWRWDVFDSTVSPADYNCHWWQLREKYQGVRSPVSRCENDFDPGAKYHIAANIEYIRYFVSFTIQFQFHRALCLEAGQYDPKDDSKPLHNCDIGGSKEAGAKLAAMLSMGSSRPWPEAMRVITGQDRMDAGALREYFRPLENWLIAKNREMGVTPGWKTDEMPCHRMPATVTTPKPNSGAGSLHPSHALNFMGLVFVVILLWTSPSVPKFFESPAASSALSL